MIQENEILMLLLGICVFIFIQKNWKRLQNIPESKTLIAGFWVVLVGWLMTVLEGFFLEELLNYIEHICYAGSSLLMVLWCWKVFRGGKEID